MSKKSGRGRSFRLPDGVALNRRNVIDGVTLLHAIPDHAAKLVVLDPQYRTGLDKLKFGNEGARQKGRAKLPQMTDDTICFLVEEAERVLAASHYLLLWVDKYAIGTGQHLRYLRRARSLKVVDVMAWNKLNIGMGRRLRCTTEYLVIVQKEPIRAKGTWTDHRIADCWPEAKDSHRHPHAKPYVLTERLIRAVTNRGDLVVDPCAGGYGVLDACQHAGRNFLGGDLL